MNVLELNVLGSHPITLTVGSLTGHMLKDKQYGIAINTVLYPDGKLLGGCISYSDCIALRDFMNEAIAELDKINLETDWNTDE